MDEKTLHKGYSGGIVTKDDIKNLVKTLWAINDALHLAESEMSDLRAEIHRFSDLIRKYLSLPSQSQP